jgi:hypothetical protein
MGLTAGQIVLQEGGATTARNSSIGVQNAAGAAIMDNYIGNQMHSAETSLVSPIPQLEYKTDDCVTSL